MFNDYSEFKPQNLMVEYTYDPKTKRPVMKNPYKVTIMHLFVGIADPSI
jgi:hypothetical protein